MIAVDTDLDDVGLGVSPVDLPLAVVQRQSVGPAQRRVDQHQPLRPVQSRPLDLGHLAPVRPVHVPAAEHASEHAYFTNSRSPRSSVIRYDYRFGANLENALINKELKSYLGFDLD